MHTAVAHRRLLCAVLGVALAALAGGAVPAAGTEGPADAGLPPVRRLRTAVGEPPPAWTAGVVMTEVPLAEFEAVLQRAAARTRKAAAPEALQTARYRARLVNDSLVGEGAWSLAGSDAAPGEQRRIEPWGQAFREPPTWSDGGSARLAAIGAESFVLPAPNAAASLSFRWSAAGTRHGAELRFRLRAPRAALATFELTLPRGLRPVAVEEPTRFFLLKEGWAQRTWTAAISSLTELPFTVVSESAVGLPQADAVRLRSVYSLEPGGAQAVFQAEWLFAQPTEAARFLVPVGLAITGVAERVGQEQELPLAWRLEPTTPPTLRVELAAARPQAALKIRGFLLKSPSEGDLELLGLSPLGAPLVAEAIMAETPVGFCAEFLDADWPAPKVAPSAAGHSEVWVLPAELSFGLKRRPRVRLRQEDAVLGARVETLWRISPGEQVQEANIAWSVQRAEVHRLQVALPADWRLEELRTAPDDRLAAHSVTANANGISELQLLLREPLTPRTPFSAEVRLRRDGCGYPEAPAKFRAAVPAPLGAAVEGALSISVAAGADARGSVPLFAWNLAGFPGQAVRPTPPPLFGASERPRADLRFRYRTANPEGELTLTPLSAELQAEARTEPGAQRLRYELKISPAAGAERTVRLRFAAPPPALAWQVRTGRNRIETVRQIDERNFAIVMATPILAPLTLEGTGDFASGRPIPLLWVANPGRCQGLLSLADPAFADLKTELPPDSSSRRQFRYFADSVAPAGGPTSPRNDAATDALLAGAMALGLVFSAAGRPSLRRLGCISIFWITLACVSAQGSEPARRTIDVFLLPRGNDADPARCRLAEADWSLLRRMAGNQGAAEGHICVVASRQSATLEGASILWRWEAEVENPSGHPLPFEGVFEPSASLELKLDGMPLRQEGGRFAIPELAPGRHKLEAATRSAPLAAGRTLRFSHPRATSAALEVSFPRDARSPRLSGPIGEVRLTPGESAVVAVADLGAASGWGLTWPEEAVSPHSSWLGVHRLRRDGGLLTLTSVFTVKAAAEATTLELQIPQGLTVASLALAEAAAAALEAHPKGAGQMIAIRLGSAAQAERRITLECWIADAWLRQIANTYREANACMGSGSMPFLGPLAAAAQPSAAPFPTPSIGHLPGRQIALPAEAPGIAWTDPSAPIGFNAPNQQLILSWKTQPQPSLTTSHQLQLGRTAAAWSAQAEVKLNGKRAPAELRVVLPANAEVLRLEGLGVRAWRQAGLILHIDLHQGFESEPRFSLLADLKPESEASGDLRFRLPRLTANGCRTGGERFQVVAARGQRLDFQAPVGWAAESAPAGALTLSAQPEAGPALVRMAPYPAAAPQAVLRLGRPGLRDAPFRLEVRGNAEPSDSALLRLRDWPIGSPLRSAEDSVGLLILRRETGNAEVLLAAPTHRAQWTLDGIVTVGEDGLATLPIVESLDGRPAQLLLQRDGDPAPMPAAAMAGEPWKAAAAR